MMWVYHSPSSALLLPSPSLFPFLLILFPLTSTLTPFRDDGLTRQIDVGGLNEMARDRNRLCIEDPFEISYNVARTVTKDGLYTVRSIFSHQEICVIEIR